MYSDDDIQYALDSTQILHEPDRRIDTFGTTRFEFHLISELMDSVNRVRIRNGFIEAERPRIVKPEPYSDMSFEGFGEQAEAFAAWLREHGGDISVFKYGFSFRKDRVTESLVTDPVPAVCDRVLGRVVESNNPLSAVIHGVDDTWEICLLKFTVQMIGKSSETNIFDFKRRGLL